MKFELSYALCLIRRPLFRPEPTLRVEPGLNTLAYNIKPLTHKVDIDFILGYVKWALV